MAGIVVEDFWNAGERLVKLRRHLHEVASHCCARKSIVATLRQHAVEGVTEFMEHGANLIPCNQRRLTLWSLGVVAYIIYNRQLSPLVALLGKSTHPGTATLGRTAEVVAIEKGDRLAVLVAHLEYLHIWVVGRDILALLEVQSVNTMGSIEHTVHLHAVDVEVWLNLIISDVEHLLLHLGRIIEAVVWLQLEVLALGLLSVSFDIAGFGISFRRILLDELLQEIVYILGVLRHSLLQRVLGVVVVTHQLSLLGTQLGNLGNDREGVELRIGAIRTMDAGHIHLAAKLTVLKIGEDSLLGGVHDDDAVRRLAATALSILFALCDIGIAQTGEFLLTVHPNHGVVGSSRKKIAKLLLEI